MDQIEEQTHGKIDEQTKIKNKIMLAIARKMGTKQNDKETAAKKNY